jgi:hypothetical protein
MKKQIMEFVTTHRGVIAKTAIATASVLFAGAVIKHFTSTDECDEEYEDELEDLEEMEDEE